MIEQLLCKSHEVYKFVLDFLGPPRQIVPSCKPKEESGIYWGYKVRYAPNISSVFKDCSYKVYIQ